MTETKSNSILFWICRIAGVYVSTWWQSLSSFFIIMDGLSLEGFCYLLVHHCLAKFCEEVGFLLSTSQKVAKETFL